MRKFDMGNHIFVGHHFEEFKGNTNGEKYQCILTDPVNKVVLDILPKRYESYLTKYFNSFSKDERSQVIFIYLSKAVAKPFVFLLYSVL